MHFGERCAVKRTAQLLAAAAVLQNDVIVISSCAGAVLMSIAICNLVYLVSILVEQSQCTLQRV